MKPTCTATCDVDSWWGAAVEGRELSSVLSDDLEGWDGGWKGDSGGRGYMYT